MNLKITHILKILSLSQISKTTLIIFILFNIIISLLEIFGISLFIILIQKITDVSNIEFFNIIIQKLRLVKFIDLSLISNKIFIYLLIVFFIKVSLSIFLNYKIYQISQLKTAKLKTDVFKILFNSTFEKYISLKPTHFFTYITNYCDDFNKVFLILLKFMSEMIIALFLIAYLVYVDYLIVSFLVITFSLFYYFYNFLLKKIKVYGKIINLSRENLVSLIDSTNKLYRELKFNYEKINYFLKRFEIANYDLMKSNTYSKLISSSPRLLIELVFVFFITFIISINLSDGFLFTKLSIFGLISIRLLPMLNQITNFFSSLNSTVNSIDKLYSEIKHQYEYDFLNHKNKSLHFDILQFESLTIRIKKKNIKLSKGDFVGIYGASGSGKTTFIESLLGLRSNNMLEISVDEKEVVDKFKFFQNNCYYLPQQTTIFPGTLINNISLSSKKDTNLLLLDDLIILFQLSHLNEFLDTNIGLGGKYLSGGEQQRVLLARALYSGKDIIILDECFNSLNEDLQIKIFKSLRKKYTQKIFLIITHNKSLSSKFTKIININDL